MGFQVPRFAQRVLSPLLIVRPLHTTVPRQQRCHYEILGVSRNATAEVLKQSFYKLAKQYHPDANPGDPTAQKKFAEISNAYEVLSDSKSRRQYDSGVDDSDEGPSSRRSSGFYERRSRPRYEWSAPEESTETEEADSTEMDPFEEFHGRGKRGKRKKQQKRTPMKKNTDKRGRGVDIQQSITLSFEDAVRGCSKVVTVHSTHDCSFCKGSGREGSSRPNRCRTCKGSGQVELELGPFAMHQQCPKCNGSGQRGQICKPCKGSGRASKERVVTITVPPGVSNDTTLRLANLGHGGTGGAADGRLHLKISVLPHRHFQRKGDDLYTTIKVPFSVAIVGGTAQFTNLLGAATTVKVNPGTQHGEQCVLKGRGVKRLNNETFGDQYVTFELETPRDLTPLQRAFFLDFGKGRGETVSDNAETASKTSSSASGKQS